MVKWALAMVLLAGCVQEDYRCRDSTDCNLGTDGVCEVDHRCTIRSASCDTGREYGPLQGELSGVCYDERRDPLNPCAEGQPPARGEKACIADVCTAMPACCRSGWTSACVQQAQLRCMDLVCDTRIAISAQRANSTELWTATYDPYHGWSEPAHYEPASSISWFAPARGEMEPRLGVFTNGTLDPPAPASLAIGGATYELAPRLYFQGQSIDFARDAHDVLLLGSVGDMGYYETLDLDTKERREFPKQYTIRTVVGEVNRDGFPDVASCANNGGYSAILNEEAVDDPTDRVLGFTGADVINGQATVGMNIEGRSIEFSDVDGNGVLDLLVAGRQIRVHMPPSESEPLNPSTQFVSIDCNPPQSPAGACSGADGSLVSWVATARPGIDQTTLVAVPFAVAAGPNPTSLPERKIYELTVDATGIVDQKLVTMGGCGATCNKKWIAVAARDLDGDHKMDLIVVDENINIYTQLSTLGNLLDLTLMIDQPRESITNVRLTVTGAPVPNP